MRFLKYLFGIFVLTLIVISCRKEVSSEDANQPSVVDAGWEFKEAGQLFNGDLDSGFIQQIGTVKTLIMVGTGNGDQNGEILLQVIGTDIQKGTYNNQFVFFQYLENGSVTFQSVPDQTSDFVLTIDALDSVSVSGTFSGTVEDALGNTHVIAEGRFSTALDTSGIDTDPDPDPITNGVLTVWSQAICNDGGSIEIKIDGQTAQITDGLTAAPLCNAAGSVSFTLPAGDYFLEAICGVDTLKYNVTISQECTVLEIDFQDPPEELNYLPLDPGATWTYVDLGNGANTQTITAVEAEVLDGREYVRFESSLGKVFYYREQQGVYYEFKTFNYQDYVDDPPTVEIVILYPEFEIGQTWEILGEQATLSGLSVMMKLVSKISRKDFTESYGGVEYTGLIEVNTEIFFSSDGGNSYSTSGSSYNTVFAPGKGIVYYEDLDTGTEWGATQTP